MKRDHRDNVGEAENLEQLREIQVKMSVGEAGKIEQSNSDTAEKPERQSSGACSKIRREILCARRTNKDFVSQERGKDCLTPKKIQGQGWSEKPEPPGEMPIKLFK